jgi:hypothetical protein
MELMSNEQGGNSNDEFRKIERNKGFEESVAS